MQFNPDPKKQANKVIFSQKSNTVLYLPFIINNSSIAKCLYQKHLGIILDSKLDLSIHIQHKIKRQNKITGLLRKDFCYVSREKPYGM